MYSESNDPEYDADLDDNIDTDNIDTDCYDCDEDTLDKICINYTECIFEQSQFNCVDLTDEQNTVLAKQGDELDHRQHEVPQSPPPNQTDTDDTVVKQIFHMEHSSD